MPEATLSFFPFFYWFMKKVEYAGYLLIFPVAAKSLSRSLETFVLRPSSTYVQEWRSP